MMFFNDDFSDTPMETIRDMAPHRVARVAFHPSGRFLACCVYDSTWRLFDLHHNLEILYQDGTYLQSF